MSGDLPAGVTQRDIDAVFDYDEPEDEREYCPRCSGSGEVVCRCGGDLCFCGAEEVPCPRCNGEGVLA